MSRVLIIGRNGQLARALQTRMDVEGRGYECVGSEDVDLVKTPDNVTSYIKATNISAVVNATGFTHVDKAETSLDAAHQLNAVAPGLMAKACAAKSIPFIHVSTDYVFDGSAQQPYEPDAPVKPINAYGHSKADGEMAVIDAGGSSAILRTSWVYDDTGKNFLTTMLRLSQNGKSVSVVDDQIGRPTYAGDLAKACLAMLSHMPQNPGIYHVSNGGEPISWAGFASAIFDAANIKCDVVPISTADYPTPAKRPAYSVLDISKFETTTGHKMPDWKDGLRAALEARKLSFVSDA